MNETCSVEGCGSRSTRRGLCAAHYKRWRRLGDPMAAKPKRIVAYGGLKCAVDGCDAPAKRRDWCKRHYERWLDHGDPLAGGSPIGNSPGSPQRYLQDVVLSHEGDECLIWPFSRNSSGYGRIRKTIVSRIVCIEVNGPPPTKRHQAAHTCGKGTSGCVAKRHLLWKDPKSNSHDKVVHGTSNRGARNLKAKIDEQTARYILSKKGLARGCDIAAELNIPREIVYSIFRGKSWKWLDGPSYRGSMP